MAEKWSVQSTQLFPSGDNPFENPFYGYRISDVDLDTSGLNKARYFGVDVSDCVHVVAIDSDLDVYMVRQQRPNACAIGETTIPILLEVPGGFVKTDKSILESANEELKEEVGMRANTLNPLGVVYPSPGVSNERDHVFLGTDLVSAPQETAEQTEIGMEIVRMPFGKLFDNVRRGQEPVAAQTLAALSMAAYHL